MPVNIGGPHDRYNRDDWGLYNWDWIALLNIPDGKWAELDAVRYLILNKLSGSKVPMKELYNALTRLRSQERYTEVSQR